MVHQQELNGDSRNATHMKFDAILCGPGYLLIPQSKPTIDDLVELNEGLEELWVGLGVAKMASEEGGELSEAVQATTDDHIEQLFRRERDGRGLNGTRAVA
jgi:hypothetical protein